MFIVCFLILFLLSSTSAKCPDVAVMPNFNASMYLGLWWEVANTPLVRDTFEKDCHCTHATYGLISSTPALLNVSVDNVCEKKDGKSQEIKGYATAQQSEPAKLKVYFSVSPEAGNYWVIDTDYQDYALVWSCTPVLGFKVEQGWILSRKHGSQMPESKLQQLLETYEKTTGYDTKKFKRSPCSQNPYSS